MVCSDDFEHDHPQKYIRVTEKAQTVPFVRKQADDTFIFVCTLAGATAFADVATADCSQADNTWPSYNDLVLVV
jgi:hypothetical protein